MAVHQGNIYHCYTMYNCTAQTAPCTTCIVRQKHTWFYVDKENAKTTQPAYHYLAIVMADILGKIIVSQYINPFKIIKRFIDIEIWLLWIYRCFVVVVTYWWFVEFIEEILGILEFMNIVIETIWKIYNKVSEKVSLWTLQEGKFIFSMDQPPKKKFPHGHYEQENDT